ncbi:hybrid sensor histidine kinase/response regulator [Granulosicoccus antarcticus]|uniref:histidine kinase n=1 Tax=Granulosicoccus antarcticus IMCC3135 TaxID=1192854 RepID=A0A2Z2NLQ7_9GAMM|nr:hybrid sensor histidine kinase/response regulator [Granulosicoccus antarcticus]ASJ72266.1 Sensor histidine kinase TodS [Granulosicoccus antarcticus IMCC3135]
MNNFDRDVDMLSDNTQAKPRLSGPAEPDASDDSLKRCCDTLAMTGHELRNPIAAMHGALSLIRDINFEAPACEILPLMSLALQIMERQLEIQTRLASDLQDLAGMERVELDVRCESLDLFDLISHTVNDLRPQAEELGLRLNLSLAESPVGLKGDPVRLTQLIGNLLGNSFKFTPRGGSIRVVMQREASTVMICVVDTGIGIDPLLLPGAFELYSQCRKASSSSHEGLGLGLYLSKRIVTLHGGTITIESAGLDLGTVVSVCLPILDEHDLVPLPSSVLASSKVPTWSKSMIDVPDQGASGRARVRRRQFQSFRIMVVEDNTDLASTMAMVLTRRGHSVLVCCSGHEALRRVNHFRPQVVLLDIGLPRMSGLELARQLRRLPATATALHIALSGQGSAESRQHSLAAGFDHYLVKPCCLGEIDALLDDFCPAVDCGV